MGTITFPAASPTSVFSMHYPAKVFSDGYLYPTAEHAYQGLKLDRNCTTILKDLARIRSLSSYESKAFVKAGIANGSLTARKDWNSVSLQMMRAVNTIKFSEKNQELNAELKKSAPYILVATDAVDNFFCVDRDGNGEGRNLLGQILMAIRDGYTI